MGFNKQFVVASQDCFGRASLANSIVNSDTKKEIYYIERKTKCDFASGARQTLEAIEE